MNPTGVYRAQPMAAAISLAMMTMGAAQAQAVEPAQPQPAVAQAPAATPAAEAAKAPAAAAKAEAASTDGNKAAAPARVGDDGVKLERIVITGTSTARSKMKQSVSVSSLSAEDLTSAPAASASELLRSVPGVRSESTGGESNANLTVRGVPLSAGGSRYVQFQEDGLPVLLVGDISFGTADTFVRADYFTGSVDVVRGGSASTMATNSPGGLINFISETGKLGGGSLGYSTGLTYRQQRADFGVSLKLGERTYGYVGGFQRVGEGVRNTDMNVESGGQVRMSLTHELGRGGYVRATIKHLNDRTPTFMPVPVNVVNGQVQAISGVDPRTAFFINSNWPHDVVRDSSGQLLVTRPADGMRAKSDSFGVEARVNFDNGISVTNRFRLARNSGRFIAPFPAGGQPTDYLGSVPVFSAHLFNTSLDDLGNQFNDLRVQKQFELGESRRLTLTGGLFSGEQRIFQTWYWNRYNVELTDSGARLFDNNGNVTTTSVTQGSTWGYCCMRHQETTINALAPYAAVTFDAGPLSIDASARHDRQRLSGFWVGGNADNTAYDPSSLVVIANRTSAPSYSVGANYELNKDLAVFARLSRGVSWASPDRTIVDAGNKLAASGAAEIAINRTQQIEAGVKYRRPGLNAAATVFSARTEEDGGVEVTTRQYLKNDFRSNGVEGEVQWNLGALRLLGGLTLTDAKITGGSNIGNKPRRQPKLTWQLSPTYVAGPVELGAQIVSTGDSYTQNDNTVKLPGFTVVNAFVNYEVTQGLTFSLGVNNLFDKIGFTEGEAQNNGCCTPGGTPVYVARSINGRSAKATLRYSF